MPEINKAPFWAPTAEAAIAHADDLIYAGVSPEAVSITQMNPWAAGNQQPRITIHDDGRVELAEGITLDQASREFWAAVQEMGLSQTAFWEKAATRNGELYSGAENQRDDLREAITRVRAIPATPQAMDPQNAWSEDYKLGRQHALNEVQRAIDNPLAEAAEA